jgi:dipeptidyl aminopeptidase/acylaminoacyl peptidase
MGTLPAGGDVLFNKVIRAVCGVAALCALFAMLAPVEAQGGTWAVASKRDYDFLGGPARGGVYLAQDGTGIVTLRDDELCARDLKGENARCTSLEIDGRRPRYDAASVQISANGRHVTYTQDFFRNLEEPDIYTVDLATQRILALTWDDFSLAGTRFRLDGEGMYPAIDILPRWGKDGQAVYFVRFAFIGRERRPAQIVNVDLTGKQTVLGAFNTISPDIYTIALSPDNTKIAYSIFTQDDTRLATNGLWLADIDGKNPVQLFRAEDYIVTPRMIQFSPDGQWLLFKDAKDAQLVGRFEAEKSPIQVIPVTGGAPMPIDPQHYVWEAGWAPDGGLVYLVADTLREKDGVYITDAVGQAGTRVLEGRFTVPVPGGCCAPITWSDNNYVLVSEIERGPKASLIQLTRK